MSSKTIARIDLRGIVHQRIMKGEKLDKALEAGLQEAAHHGASVLDQTGDLSIALSSMGIDSTDSLESAIRQSIGEQTVSPKMFLKTVLTVVGGGGVTSIPTASCLYKYLPHDRKPTREEMEEAWEKCCRQTISANQ
jgi:hypothetical protein